MSYKRVLRERRVRVRRGERKLSQRRRKLAKQYTARLRGMFRRGKL